jgi:hypothetical protein
MLLKTIIGVPKKMTSRRFYGSHFHTLTVHAPDLLFQNKRKELSEI